MVQAECAHLTDVGNAQRLVKDHGDDLRYVGAWKRWLVWDSKRWVLDETHEVERRAKDTVHRMNNAADGKLAEHGRLSESAARLASMIALARSEPGIAMRPEDFDRDLWSLNVANGALSSHRDASRASAQ